MRLLSGLLAISVFVQALVLAQNPANSTAYYQISPYTTGTLSNASETTVIQLPANAAFGIWWDAPPAAQVNVTCTAAATVQIYWNGTGASGTAVAVVPTPQAISQTNPHQTVAVVYSSATITGGYPGSLFQAQANVPLPLNMNGLNLVKTYPSAQNISIVKTIATSGTCTVNVQWKEI